MKGYKLRLFIWSMLVVIILVALPSLMNSGTKLIGKSFVDTDEFTEEMAQFYDKIGPAVLNRLDEEEAKKAIQVGRDEIEEHRDRYGSLPDQITNIYDQYGVRIEEAKASGNEALTTTLIEERDKKIADIKQNFESAEHIEEKIRAEKEKVIDRYLASIKNAEVRDFPIAYEFTDVETGETFSAGDIEAPAAYKKKFNAKDGLFKANALSQIGYETEWSNEEYSSNSSWRDTVSVMENTPVEVDEDLTWYKKPVRTFEGVVIVPKTALAENYLSERVNDYNKKRYISYALWILAALSALILLTGLKFKKEWVTETAFTERYDALKMDVKAAILFLSLLITTEYISGFSHQVVYYLLPQYGFIWWKWASGFIFIAILIVFFTFQVVNIFERWKHKGVFEQDFQESYTIKLLQAFPNMFLKRTIGIQTFILLIGFFLAGIGFVSIFMQNFLVVFYVPAVLFLGLPAIYIFVRRTAYLNRIIVATEAMAAGRLQKEIAVEGKSPLAEHARNLNNLREGVRVSLNEQAKSERLKTELITNVSHDLRTPLTSIITYTDLLKSEALPVEERAKYVDILDKKSQRLKTLIEDLFEVSKMASGNLELTKQRVDLTQLLQQALAEHEEAITETGLDFRVNLPQSALIAFIDGKRWWRVLDNLIVNAIKYTMPGTRVYITLRKTGDHAEFVVKNVTKYELGESTEELFERFKRADTSRHTEGSGLGLAIAQSIVDMHDGDMKIEVDGDLFKVTVIVPVVY